MTDRYSRVIEVLEDLRKTDEMKTWNAGWNAGENRIYLNILEAFNDKIKEYSSDPFDPALHGLLLAIEITEGFKPDDIS